MADAVVTNTTITTNTGQSQSTQSSRKKSKNKKKSATPESNNKATAAAATAPNGNHDGCTSNGVASLNNGNKTLVSNGEVDALLEQLHISAMAAHNGHHANGHIEDCDKHGPAQKTIYITTIASSSLSSCSWCSSSTSSSTNCKIAKDQEVATPASANVPAMKSKAKAKQKQAQLQLQQQQQQLQQYQQRDKFKHCHAITTTTTSTGTITTTGEQVQREQKQNTLPLSNGHDAAATGLDVAAATTTGAIPKSKPSKSTAKTKYTHASHTEGQATTSVAAAVARTLAAAQAEAAAMLAACQQNGGLLNTSVPSATNRTAMATTTTTMTTTDADAVSSRKLSEAGIAGNAARNAAITSNTITTTSVPDVDAASAVPLEVPAADIHIEYTEYEAEHQMHDIMRLIQAELSEPYSIYTYRYFIYNWPKLCFLARHGNDYVGAIVCKLDMHMNVRRGYIAMLAVRKEYRKLKIGTTLVQKAIEAMLADNADEVVLETEMRNVPALRLYENLGFVRDKRLFRYYLNGVDALRLKLWFR